MLYTQCQSQSLLYNVTIIPIIPLATPPKKKYSNAWQDTRDDDGVSALL